MKKHYGAITFMITGLVIFGSQFSHADPMPTPMPGGMGTIATKDVTVDFTYDLDPFEKAHPAWGVCKAIGVEATLKTASYNETEGGLFPDNNAPSHVTFINVPLEDGTLNAGVELVCQNKSGATGFSAAQQAVASTQYYATVRFEDLP